MRVFAFQKAERLTRRSEFKQVLSQGDRIHTRHFVVVFCPNSLGIRRLGLIASKKVGNAVQRNRIKRLLREAFRQNKGSFPASSDTVIIAKNGAPFLRYGDVRAELLERLP